MRWLFQAHGFHDRRSDVDVGDHFVYDRSTFKQLRALSQHRHSNRSLVGHPLVDQTVLSEHKPVVAHVDDQRFVVNAHFLEFIQNRTDTVINRAKCFAVTLVILLDIQVTLVREVNAVPTIALIKQPTRPIELVAVNLCFAGGSFKRFVSKLIGVFFFRCEFGVNGFVRQVQKERFFAVFLLVQKVDSIPSQQSRDVAVLRNSLSVFVDRVVRSRRRVMALSAETDPVIKTRPRVIRMAAHMPLTNEARLVTGVL